MLARTRIPEKIYAIFLFCRNWILVLVNRFLVTEVEQGKDLPSFVYHSINSLVIKIAVNKDVAIPINKVVANPLIGPVPKIKRMIPVRAVVMFASRIDESAFLNPSALASF